MRSYGSCVVRSQIVAIFGQKSDFGDFSTSKNNTWVRRSAEKFSAWTTNINYFLQKNFHGHTTLRKISLRSSRGGGKGGFPPPWKSSPGFSQGWRGLSRHHERTNDAYLLKVGIKILTKWCLFFFTKSKSSNLSLLRWESLKSPTCSPQTSKSACSWSFSRGQRGLVFPFLPTFCLKTCM